MVKKLRLICFVLVACLFGLTPVYADFVNGGFETGDRTGWDLTNMGTSALVTVVHTDTTFTDGYSSPTTVNPTEGYYFLRLEAGAATYDESEPPVLVPVATEVQQVISIREGNTISGWAFFDARDSMSYNDYAYVIVSTEDVQTPWTKNIADTGDYGETGWMEWSWTVPDYVNIDSDTDILLKLRYGVINVGDNVSPSVAYFDDTKVTTTAVPEPATLILLMAGVMGIGMVRRNVH